MAKDNIDAAYKTVNEDDTTDTATDQENIEVDD
eukprot:CAMPEP_0116879610 /NCGR_PEP_ID=MMETSP0463-20121206/11417_1 /TAXON_ID=181622 /ORGANISM="Strombidinopsis sp, Strain SopsisLIS2011" /LENGTH=32 /DNA_ID= /DNA_START= /DNA_END= /DNA_ORIENTATION=